MSIRSTRSPPGPWRRPAGTEPRPSDLRHDYICFPTPTEKRERGEHAPMCLDKVWLAWKEAWMRNEPFKAERVGIAYMLSAEATAGSIDPDVMKPASGDGLF